MRGIGLRKGLAVQKNTPDPIKDGQGVNVFSQTLGQRENNSKAEDGGFKIPIPELVEDNSRRVQGGNAQGKSGSHPLDEFLKGFEDSLL